MNSREMNIEYEKKFNQGFSWIYVVGSFEHLKCVKIGMSKRTTCKGRIQQLQTAFPYLLHSYAEFQVNTHHVIDIEKRVHDKLKEFRLKGEWFSVHPKDAIESIKEILNVV